MGYYDKTEIILKNKHRSIMKIESKIIKKALNHFIFIINAIFFVWCTIFSLTFSLGSISKINAKSIENNQDFIANFTFEILEKGVMDAFSLSFIFTSIVVLATLFTYPILYFMMELVKMRSAISKDNISNKKF